MMEPHTKIGRRPIVMPLARIVMTVTKVLMPATVTDSTNVQIVTANMSCPGNDCTESGA